MLVKQKIPNEESKASPLYHVSSKCAWMMSNYLKLDILKNTPFIKWWSTKPYNGDKRHWHD